MQKKTKKRGVGLTKRHATLKAESDADRLRRVLNSTDTENPNPQDLAELRACLEEYPELWKIAGDFADYAVRRIIKSAANQALVRESARQGLEVLKKELGFERALALERILIENVAVCWLQWTVTENKYVANVSASASIASADYWERRLTQTEIRYLRACETLARVRKLTQPGALQVNIGAQQVNIAPSGTAGAPALPDPGEKAIEGEC